MKQDQETYELIERYLRGELEGEALLRFEQTLEEDASLKEEVALQGAVHTLLADEEVNQLEEQLSALRTDYSQAPKQRSMKRLWLAAAATLILIATYVGLFRGGDDLTGTELYTAYFELYPADNAIRSADSVQTALSRGLKAYEAKEFKKALKILEPLIKDNTRARFYYGVSQLAGGTPDRALAVFQQIDDTSIYSDPAHWYTVLALLRQNEIVKAVSLLERMEQNTRGKYQKLAIELLEKLR